MSARAKAVLENKSLSSASGAYKDTKVFASIREAQSEMGGVGDLIPDLIILGSPPAFRGRINQDSELDAERQLTDAFPRSAVFVEKPISTGAVAEANGVADLLESRKTNLVSVGYMLRYSKAVQKMKDILRENRLTVMMTSARYVMGMWASFTPPRC